MKYTYCPDGLTETRKVRSTGTYVSLYDNREGQYMDNPNRVENWYTTCIDHAIVCSHQTKADALSWMTDPAGWCEICAELQKPDPQIDPAERTLYEGNRVAQECYNRAVAKMRKRAKAARA